ncbi:hydrogenase 3 maturation endopeptidase HyCI [candidate division WOR-3 bacterium]|nr:hydrogenase 3 maturation endopeptidase HyCI [candidate division WOR-3 bacterium]
MAGAPRQLVILGVGNRLRGDDAVGCIVCDELLGAGHDRPPRDGFWSCPKPEGTNSPPRHQDTKASPAESPQAANLHSPIASLFILDCGNTPENYVQPIADRKPDRILIVDCCDFGGEAGEFRIFGRPEIDQLSYGLMSTHTLPLTLTIEMLSLQTTADIELLGIQPQQIEFNTDLSPVVRAALPGLVQFIRDWARA